MNTFFSNIEDLKKVVKINASLPWESIEPYLDDAQTIYLEHYIGPEIIKKASDSTYANLVPYICRALGPLTLMLATPELGISIGDAGITVSNEQGKRSPANEAKIAAAAESFKFRGFQALDRLLLHLQSNVTTYKEFEQSRYCKLIKNSLIKSAEMFQDVGLVNIEYSIITFISLIPTAISIQDKLPDLLGDTLTESLLTKAELTVKEKVLIDLIIKMIANKTAELFTAAPPQTSSSTPYFTPSVRPIYNDSGTTGNYFAAQAEYYQARINKFMLENSAELGLAVPEALNWNKPGNRIFAGLT